MKTYVKIDGKDVDSIVQKVAKLAVDLDEICVWDLNILDMGWGPARSPIVTGQVSGYFGMDTKSFTETCDKIVAKSGGDLGGYNLYFEWLTPPSDVQLNSLRKKIDDIIKPFGNKYEITNKK